MAKARSPIQLAVSFLARHKLALTSAVFWRGLWEVVPMQIPILAGVIVSGLAGEETSIYGVTLENSPAAAVLQIAAIGLFVVAVCYGISAYVYTLADARLGKRFVADMRKQVIEKTTLLSLESHQHFGSGDLIDRTLRDTDRLRNFLTYVFIRSCTNVVRTGYPLAMLFILDPVLALIALSIIPVQWLATWYLQRKLHDVVQSGLAGHSELTTSVKECIDGAETVQSIGAEATCIRQLQDKTEDVESLELQADHITAVIRSIVWLMTGIGVALVWWQGGAKVAMGAMTLGTLVVFTGFVEFAYRPFRFFPRIVKFYQQGMASLGRIHELLETPSTIQEAPNAATLRINTGRIAFENVSFSYQEEPILRDVSLAIEPYSLTALVGRSGCGKSTMLRLIARLYDPSAGYIRIDDQQLEQVSLRSVRSQIAAVAQSPTIFSATIVDNLTIAAPSATRAEVEAACSAAGALEFIDQLDDGLETKIGKGGVRLSGGQAQRLAIARALLCKPKILLLDEPTSALDNQSQNVIVQTLQRLARDMTVVVVGHRLETIREADRIVVMRDGEVEDVGTHLELSEQSPYYRSLFTETSTNDCSIDGRACKTIC